MAPVPPPSHSPRWTALLLAGSRPGGDPFALANGVELKPLIPVAGEPMILRALRALLASPLVEGVKVLTQDVDGIAVVLPTNERITVQKSGTTIASTLQTILADGSVNYPLLVTTADHALLDPAMIAEFAAGSTGCDISFGVVERRSLTAVLPQSKRTWIRFRGGAYSGANLFAFGSPAALKAVALWRAVEQDRKKGWRMLAAFGPALLLGAGLGLRTLDQSVSAIGRRLGINARAVVMTNPLAAVDVDKQADLELVETLLRTPQ